MNQLPRWLLCAGVTAFGVACGRGSVLICANGGHGIVTPVGFCASVFAENIRFGRHITVTEDGRVFVIRQRPGDDPSRPTSVLALYDSNRDEAISDHERREFGSVYGSDIKWRTPHLYVSSPIRVVRYKLNDRDLVPSGEPETVIQDFPQSYGMEHTSRPFTFDPEGQIYLHVGTPSNSCQEENRVLGSPGISPCPSLENWGGVWRFPANALGLRFPTDGAKVVSGMRHTLGMIWNRQAGVVNFVQQGRDELHDLFPDAYTQDEGAALPSEELLEATPGANFGWPYCYFDPAQNRRVLAPEYGGDGKEAADCGGYSRPLAVFPAHTSPSDMLWYTGTMFPERFTKGVFVSFAGGWGRRPFDQLGYNIAFVPYADGRPTGTWEVFADGFARKAPIRLPTDAEGRPSGLGQMPDGSLLVLDSRKGVVWRIRYSRRLAPSTE